LYNDKHLQYEGGANPVQCRTGGGMAVSSISLGTQAKIVVCNVETQKTAGAGSFADVTVTFSKLGIPEGKNLVAVAPLWASNGSSFFPNTRIEGTKVLMRIWNVSSDSITISQVRLIVITD
jgi:hypothetical protein